MVLDKLREFAAKFREEDNEDSPEILSGMPDPDIDIEDVYGPCIPEDVIDEPTLCMYGPAPGYDDEDLDTCDPDVDDIIEKEDAQ